VIPEPAYLNELANDPKVQGLASQIEFALSHDSVLSLNSDGTSVKTIWKALTAEVYDLLCTKSPKYQKERALIEKTGKPAIVALTTYLTGTYGMEIGAAGGVATLAFVLPFKIALNSWCSYAKVDDQTSQKLQRKALREMSTESTAEH